MSTSRRPNRSGFSLFALGALMLGSALPAAAQSGGRWVALLGGGSAEHGGQLVPSLHAGVRNLIFSQDSVYLIPNQGPGIFMLERLDLYLEGQFQRSSGASRCGVIQQRGCWRTEHLLSTGLTGIWGATPERHPVQLYFVVASVGLHASMRTMLNRGAPTESHPFGVYTPGPRDWRVGVGVGNGAGVRATIGGYQAVLELKPTLIRFDDGTRGGSIPVSLGIRF